MLDDDDGPPHPLKKIARVTMANDTKRKHIAKEREGTGEEDYILVVN